jgi:hypothetical protein
MTDELGTPSPRKLLLTALATSAVAALILILIVLPAEYQIDPTGFGRMLGLDRLAGVTLEESGIDIADAPSGFAVLERGRFRSEERLIEMAPHEEMEIKMALVEGATAVFSWKVEGGEIYSDFHAEPFGEPEGGAIRYDEAVSTFEEHGSVHAPFGGHHGWYWVNPNDFPVSITLEVSGYYSVLKERRAELR